MNKKMRKQKSETRACEENVAKEEEDAESRRSGERQSAVRFMEIMRGEEKKKKTTRTETEDEKPSGSPKLFCPLECHNEIFRTLVPPARRNPPPQESDDDSGPSWQDTRCSTLALAHLNEKCKLVDAHATKSSALMYNGRAWFHVNFKAKPIRRTRSTDDSPKLFFSEILHNPKAKGRGGVMACCIVEPETPGVRYRMGCGACYNLKHLVKGYRAGRWPV